MKFWINVEDSLGVKQGSGPIMTAERWQNVRRLDRAGTFSFSMPATDSRIGEYGTLIKKVARCYGVVNDVVTELGAGIIDKVAYKVGAEGRVMLTISGDDLLRELTYRSVHNLELYDLNQYNAQAVYKWDDNGTANITADDTFTNITQAYDDDEGTDTVVVALAALNQFLLIGYDHTFQGLDFVLSTPFQANVSGWGWGYSQEGGTDWTEFDVTSETHDVGGKPFAQSGQVMFVREPQWGKATLNAIEKYWVRFDPTAALTNFDINEVYALVPDPTTDDLAGILALAPAGWALDGSPYRASTESGTYQIFAGETVLEALIKVAERHGEHFRLGAGREIQWMWAGDTESNDLRAIAGVNPVAVEANTDVCLIESFEEIEDAYDLVTRIYPYGGGNSDARVTLALAGGVTVPTDYTLNVANNYIESDVAAAAYPRIESVVQFKEIAAVDQKNVDDRAASEELFEQALTWLQQHDAPYKSYRLRVTKVDKALLPGATIDVIYRRVVDGYEAVDIDETLTVLEATTEIDSSGIRTVALQVANVKRWPVSESEMVAKELQKSVAYQAHAQPVLSGLVR